MAKTSKPDRTLQNIVRGKVRSDGEISLDLYQECRDFILHFSGPKRPQLGNGRAAHHRDKLAALWEEMYGADWAEKSE